MRNSRALRTSSGSVCCRVEELERRDCPAAVSIASVAVPEGTNASPVAKLLVTLSAKSSSTVIVNWATADGSATVADNDYRAASGTISFSPGQTSKMISVYLCGDDRVEQDEFFNVSLSNPVGATIGRATATVTIRNDDVPQPVIPSLSISDTQLLERNFGRSEARFMVTLSEATTVPVTVRCGTIDGAATIADRDYASTSLKLVFAPGEITKIVAVSVLGDTKLEPDENFGLVLTGATGATIEKSTATVTIQNDDFLPPPPVVVSVTGSTIVEGNGGSDPARFATFTVTLSRASGTAVSVAYQTADGSAKSIDNDYRVMSGILTFAAGETTKTIQVPIIGDTKPERDETFSLVLLSATGALLDRTPASATLIDDDTLPEVRVVGSSLREGDSGISTASFVISLSEAWDQPVVVSYATRDGSAKTNDSDYIQSVGSVTFASGETEKTVSVSVVGDTRAEIDETFFLDLSSAENATLAIATATATIQNDDSGEVSGFQITVEYSGTVRQSIKDACVWAAQRWSQVIVGDLPSVWDAQNGVYVDDLRITVQEGLLGGGNGPGGALANAGPIAFRSDASGLPWDAEAGIDPSDAGDPQLNNIVLHEFGHALGFGISGRGVPTFYSRFVVGSGFTGGNAVQAYRSLFRNSATSVPLETGGGAGTAGAHWSESVMKNELMTGYSEAPGVAMPISVITVGAMQDMGYEVNVGAADPFTAAVQSAVTSQTIAGAGLPAPESRRARGAASPSGTRSIVSEQMTSIAAARVSLTSPAASTEITQVAAGRTSRERLFQAYAAGISPAPDARLSALAWRSLGAA